MAVQHKRFIAGAVCPACAQIDKVVLYRDKAGQAVRECVRCGFRQELDEQGAPQPPTTRVSGSRPGEPPLPGEDAEDIVRIIKPE